MNPLLLLIGSIASLLGLGIIVLTILFLRENRVKNILTGIVFAIVGASIIWLGIQGNDTLQINIGISDKQFGFMIFGFVIFLFILGTLIFEMVLRIYKTRQFHHFWFSRASFK